MDFGDALSAADESIFEGSDWDPDCYQFYHVTFPQMFELECGTTWVLVESINFMSPSAPVLDMDLQLLGIQIDASSFGIPESKEVEITMTSEWEGCHFELILSHKWINFRDPQLPN